MFRKYQHVERLGHSETEGILEGVCHLFYKLDGTNASLWLCPDEGTVKAGSRNRILSFDNDNAGFINWVYTKDNLHHFLREHPHLYLYGEWLVPHSLKTYREEAWRDLYVFDVLDTQTNLLLPYEAYKPLLDKFEINYIPPLAIIKNPNEESLIKCLEKTGEFLVADGAGKGEGFVIKNYDYTNRYGRQVWAKMVTNEFKEVHHKEMGAPEINNTLLPEEVIVRDFLTDEFIRKEISKIVSEGGGEFNNKMIPEILGRVWYEFIREETWTWVKALKNPKVNFKFLQGLVQRRTKDIIGI